MACMGRASRSRRPCARGEFLCADPGRSHPGPDSCAARLESIAEAGGVCISDDAYRQVRSKVDMACDDLGPQTLKNIAEPMRAWRVKIGGQSAATPQPRWPAGQTPRLCPPRQTH